MNDSVNEPASRADASERKPYVTPALLELGSVLTLTQGSSGSTSDGGSNLRPIGTH
ncbi:MAG TPA: hypothetical protein VGM56_20370 [Byssovorax sp.]|jgi:hypothetical protein